MPCWWTLMVVLSSIRVLPSTMSWAISSSKTCSQTPCRLHRRNRVYTLFQGPYRSGRSLQGIPVFSQYRIPLSITRLSFPGLPPCAGFSGGNRSFTLFHCSSVNSCRFMPLLYCCFLDLSILCLKTPFRAGAYFYFTIRNFKSCDQQREGFLPAPAEDRRIVRRTPSGFAPIPQSVAKEFR